MSQVILDFVKQRGRIVYGGYAMNALIAQKAPEDVFYDFETEVPDVEFYSSDAVIDARDLCDAFHAKGYKYVRGNEAFHAETYKVAVDLQQLCDISYVPKNILRAVPYVTLGGIRFAHPHFMLIDSLRILTDPLLSYWRLDKAFPRIYALQKHYPLDRAPGEGEHEALLAQARGKRPETSDAVEAVLELARTALDASRDESAVVVGLAAFERFAAWSTSAPAAADAASKSAAAAPFVELVLTDYKASAQKIYDGLVTRFGDADVAYEEHHRFFDYCGRRGLVYVRGRLAAVLFHSHNRCTPVLPLRADGFESATLRTATLSTAALYMLVQRLICRAADDRRGEAVCGALAYELYAMRRRFLDGSSTDVTDADHPFNEFTANCVGRAVSALRAHKEETEYRKARLGLFGMAYFNYEPANPNPKRDNVQDYKYMNSSGNPVRNPADLLFAPATGLVNLKYAEEKEKELPRSGERKRSPRAKSQKSPGKKKTPGQSPGKKKSAKRSPGRKRRSPRRRKSAERKSPAKT